MARNLSVNSVSSLSVVRLLTLVGAVLALLVSCSDNDEAHRGKKARPAADESTWAIHVYVGEPGARKRVDIAPVPEVSFPAGPTQFAPLPASPSDLWNLDSSTRSRPATETSEPGSNTQAVIGDADGGGKEFVQDLSGQNGWALAWGAAVQCTTAGRTGAPVVPPWKQQPVGFAWSIFQRPPNSCDQEVIYSETLLCVANELARIAEATAPTC